MFTVHLLMLELFKRLCHCTMILSFVNRASIKIKGATSRKTQLEKAGKFFQVCHS